MGALQDNPLFAGLAVFFTLRWILQHSRLGLEVRSVSQNRAMARNMGVRSGRVNALTFGLGSGIAGLAGVALGDELPVNILDRADVKTARGLHGNE